MDREHQGFVHDDWRPGFTCDECQARIEFRKTLHAQQSKIVNFAITRLQNDREGGYTQNELAKEMFDAARKDGRDIAQVR